MNSDEDTLYKKNVELDVIYNFKVQTFLLESS
jgi:hypothetical protein